MSRRRLVRLFLKTDSINTPLNGTYTAGGRDIVDFRIERPYVEICWSCFLHCARKRSYVEICWSCFLVDFRVKRSDVDICRSCFLHCARMIGGKKLWAQVGADGEVALLRNR